MERVRAMIGDGTIGQVREIQSRFHFVLDDPDNIRLFANLAGGSIQDVGCYPIRLARLLFDAEPDLSRAMADAEWTADGADTELWGALVFPGDRRLVFSCGFRSGYDTLTRVLGTEGEIRLTGPFHPDSDDEMTIVRDGELETQPAPTSGEMSFTPAIRGTPRRSARCSGPPDPAPEPGPTSAPWTTTSLCWRRPSRPKP
jgi:predicted dehydrogenase